MVKKFHLILILVLSLFYSPSHAKEVYKSQENLSSNIEEVAKEISHLNSGLDLLSNTISNLIPEDRI